jgi:hypothetical protein
MLMNDNKGASMSDPMNDVESSLEKLEAEAKSAFDAARGLAADLGKLGADWARYGLAVGKSSVQASADSLEQVAGALRKLASRMRDA